MPERPADAGCLRAIFRPAVAEAQLDAGVAGEAIERGRCRRGLNLDPVVREQQRPQRFTKLGGLPYIGCSCPDASRSEISRGEPRRKARRVGEVILTAFQPARVDEVFDQFGVGHLSVTIVLALEVT